MSRRIFYGISAAFLISPAPHSIAKASLGIGAQVVAQCASVSLQASYLAEEKPGGGSGFLLQIRNRGDAAISIVDPVPLSVHWYAASGGRWEWRASSGSGGSLVNALRESGPLFAARQPANSLEPSTRTVPAHGSYSWTAFSGDTAALRYRPGCQHCQYVGEQQFRAVLAYAYLPSMDVRHAAGLLRCGLRSAPVVMPPLIDSQKPHNSITR